MGKYMRNNIDKDIKIIEINEENYVEEARKIIKKLYKQKRVLTTSKIRKLLAMLSDMYIRAKNLEGDKLNKALLDRLQYFKVHVVYEAGRERLVESFIEEACIIEQIDKIKDDKSRLILFYHYMEALVAYRKYICGKDE